MYAYGAPPPPQPRRRPTAVIAVVAALIALGVGVGAAAFAVLGGHLSLPGARRAPTWGLSPPSLHDLNGDGVDDLYGALDGVTAAALDGRTGADLWRKGGMIGAASIVTTEQHLVVLEGDAVKVFDVRTGKALATHRPPWKDKPSRLLVCDGKLWAVAIDDTSHRLDPATGKASDEVPPASCASPAARSGPCRGAKASCAAETQAGAPDRRPTLLRDEAAKRAVRLTFKERGTAIATATRVEPADGASLVVAPAGELSAADVAGDWLVVARGRELFAYDFATKASWTAPLPGYIRPDSRGGWLRVARGRVYASPTPMKDRGPSELVVLDLATGKPVWR